MAGKPSARGTIVRKYCEQHPDLPDLTIARMIWAHDQADFNSINAIRQAVRYHRGKNPPSCVRVTKAPIASTVDQSSRVPFVYRAPKTMAKKREPFLIHGPQRILRLSDIHFPLHDADALNAAIDYGVKHDPTIILLDGDIMDFHDFSTHERTTLQAFVMQEVEMMVDFFDGLRKTFPKARIIYKEGNHEERLTRYLFRRAPELAATDCFDLPAFVRFLSGRDDAMHRVEWVSDKRVIRAGHLSFLHGHEYKGGGGVTPARWLMLRTRESAICGHFHRRDEHSSNTLNGRQIGTWSSGCLCDLKPDYLPNNEWTHGFIWVEVDKDGEFTVRNHRIINGRVY